MTGVGLVGGQRGSSVPADLVALLDQADAIAKDYLTRIRLTDLPGDIRVEVEQLARRLPLALLMPPVRLIQQHPDPATADAYTQLLTALFHPRPPTDSTRTVNEPIETASA